MLQQGVRLSKSFHEVEDYSEVPRVVVDVVVDVST